MLMARKRAFPRFFLKSEVLRYLLVGALITLADVAVFNVLLFTLDLIGLSSTAVARALTFSVSLTVAFVLHERVTFSRRVRRGNGVRIGFIVINVFLAGFALIPFWIIDQFYSENPSYHFLNAVNLATILCFTVVRFVLYRSLLWKLSSGTEKRKA